MPIYLYDCPDCGQIELKHGFQVVIKACPTCGKPITKKLNKPAVIFKGSGFYSTDDRKRKKQ